MVKKIEVVDAGMPSRQHMQSPWHNRRIQRIGLFALVILTVVTLGIYNRPTWAAADLRTGEELANDSSYTSHVPSSSSKDDFYVDDSRVPTDAGKPQTPPTPPLKPDVKHGDTDYVSDWAAEGAGKSKAPSESSGSKTPDTKTSNSKTAASKNMDLDPTRVALIIETRPISHLPALILSFISNLPHQWVVRHVGDTPAFDLIRSHKPLLRHIESGKLVLTELPERYPTKNNEDLSATLTNLSFYRDFLAPAEWVLMFQTDSMICSGSPMSLDDFVDLGYDWTGAPWHPNVSGGNGGLSLRHIPPIVELLNTETRVANDGAWEDLWLCERLKNAAPAALEAKFSVESIYEETPLGYHLRGSGKLVDASIWGNRTRRRHIFNYCPEIKIVMGIMSLEDAKEEQWRMEDEGLIPIAAEKNSSASKTSDGDKSERPSTLIPEGVVGVKETNVPDGLNIDKSSWGDKTEKAKPVADSTWVDLAQESKAAANALKGEATDGRWGDEGKP